MRDIVDDRERTIVGIGDLKKIIAGCFGVGLTIVAFLCQHYNSQLTIRAESDRKQDIKIQQLEDQGQENRRTSERIEQSLASQQKLQNETVLQMNTLTGKVSATEEVTRSIRDNVEAMLRYMRKSDAAVLSTDDSIYAPRGIQR